MKDKTHAMNMGYSAEEAAAGFSNAGTPESSHARKKRQLADAGLADSRLRDVENLAETGYDVPGGFIKRNNYGDRD